MSWFLPCLMFALSAVFWRLAHRSDELLTAWIRLGFAMFLLAAGALLAAAAGIGEVLYWAVTHFTYAWI